MVCLYPNVHYLLFCLFQVTTWTSCKGETYIFRLPISISWKTVFSFCNLLFLLGQQWQMKDLGNMWMGTCYSGQQMWDLTKDIEVQYNTPFSFWINAWTTVHFWPLSAEQIFLVQVFVLESLIEVCLLVLWLCKLCEEAVSCAGAS